jgi:hypothetical protein
MEPFIPDEKPVFVVVNIAPSLIVGKNELVTDVKDITLRNITTVLGVIRKQVGLSCFW